MKSILSLISLLLVANSLMAMPSDSRSNCSVKLSNDVSGLDPMLEKGMNKEVICLETIRSLTGATCRLADDFSLFITVTGNNKLGHDLEIILSDLKDSDSPYYYTAILDWNLNYERVILNNSIQKPTIRDAICK